MYPREEENCFDHGVRRAPNELREYVEMGARVCGYQRKDEEDTDDDCDAVPLKSSERRRQCIWQYTYGDASAVERGQRDQVEDGQENVELDGVRQIREHPLAGNLR